MKECLLNYIKNDVTNEEIIEIGKKLCDVLGEQKSLISPENIIIHKNEFEIERRTIKEKFDFMSPEAFHGEKKNLEKQHVYLVGMLLYVMLNNHRLPFSSGNKDKKQALRRRFDGEALQEPFRAGKRLSNIILKAIAYNPTERFTSVIELKAALDSLEDSDLIVLERGEATEVHSEIVKEDINDNKNLQKEIVKNERSLLDQVKPISKYIAFGIIGVILVTICLFTIILLRKDREITDEPEPTLDPTVLPTVEVTVEPTPEVTVFVTMSPNPTIAPTPIETERPVSIDIESKELRNLSEIHNLVNVYELNIAYNNLESLKELEVAINLKYLYANDFRNKCKS